MIRTARTALASLGVVAAFGSVALAQQNHDVMMHIEPVEGRPVPAFSYEPVGLLIQPGDTVTFVAVSPHHTATAHHARHVKSQRVPDGVFALDGLVLNQPEIASARIVANGSVSSSEIVEAVLAAGLP